MSHSDYEGYFSPDIINHPGDWVSPKGMMNPFNPLKGVESSTTQNQNSTYTPHEDGWASACVILIIFALIVSFIVLKRKISFPQADI